MQSFAYLIIGFLCGAISSATRVHFEWLKFGLYHLAVNALLFGALLWVYGQFIDPSHQTWPLYIYPLESIGMFAVTWFIYMPFRRKQIKSKPKEIYW